MVGAATAALITLSACSTPGGEGSPSADPSGSASPAATASPSATVSPAADLSAVQVTDATPPVVTVEAPWAIAETQSKVLKPSTEAQKIGDKSAVSVKYVGVNGTTGEVFESTFEGEPVTLTMDRVVAGFQKGLVGQAVGSRVLIGIPSADGYPQGNQSGTIKAGDSLIFVVDILSSKDPETVTPAAGLPTVTMTDDKPEITIPADVPAPTELKIQPLIKGVGDPVTADSTIQVMYRSWTYADGKLFQDAWTPQAGMMSSLIKGWQQGLVGQTVGSRVLLVVPPALAYPDGQPSATPALAANQTLVYVVEIVDAVAGS